MIIILDHYMIYDVAFINISQFCMDEYQIF